MKKLVHDDERVLDEAYGEYTFPEGKQNHELMYWIVRPINEAVKAVSPLVDLNDECS